MNPLMNDPMLTAFALGELHDVEPDRVEEIAAAVDADPALAAEVERIQEAAALIEAQLGVEPGPALTPAQREAIFAADESLRAPIEVLPVVHRPARRWWPALTAATGLAAVAVIAMFGVARLDNVKKPMSGDIVPVPAGEESVTASAENGTSNVESGEGVEWTLPKSKRRQRVRSRRKIAPKGEPYVDPNVGDVDLPSASIDDSIPLSNPSPSTFSSVDTKPVATFSVDVDTASYTYVRRALAESQWPYARAVRIEEMINYFDYDLPEPSGSDPIAVVVDVTDAPWNPNHLVARVALKAKSIVGNDRPNANLVFLIDVSGSMSPRRRLPLVKRSLRMLLKELQPNDTVSIVTYAGESGVALAPTSASDAGRITAAIDRLEAEGGTNGGDGLRLAYRAARQAFKANGINRVIAASDGDFNMGTTDRAALDALITKEAKSNVFLTVLGYGMDNLNDANLEALADRGNGHYAYIDDLAEAKRVLVKQISSTLVTVAKDVKVQLEMNPARVAEYRLVGYENRKMLNRAFDDDREDAGDMGAGHAVTMLYELVPPRGDDTPEKLRYQRPLADAAQSGELFAVKVRYKEPDSDTSKLIERFVHESKGHFDRGAEDLRFATAVAAFGMLLRSGPDASPLSFDDVAEWAEGALGDDVHGQRTELVRLVRRAKAMQAKSPARPTRPPSRSPIRLTEQDIRGVISGNVSSVSSCVQPDAIAASAQGKYEFSVRVDPTGVVTKVRLATKTKPASAVTRCIEASIAKWRFPPFDGEAADLTIPFIMRR